MMYRRNSTIRIVESVFVPSFGFEGRAGVLSWRRWAIATSIGLGALVGTAPEAIANPLPESFPDGELIAQQIVEGLPPPPPILGVPSTPVNLSANSNNLYLVYVNGDSPLLLDQVRRVSTDASVQDYQGQPVIQAGIFEEPTYAQQQVSALEAQGIMAEVAEVPEAWFEPALPAQTPVEVQTATVSVPLPPVVVPPPEMIPVEVTPREIEFGRSPDVAAVSPTTASYTNTESEGSHFYVVIPARTAELADVSAQVIRLGANFNIAGSVEERTAPLGPHVRVGPFIDREAASRWSSFFGDFGLNARVYYSR
ncbi:MAG: hypothetical protein IGR76_01115 [Synechococcales cyanobacterium T60_A2020_003]|nr:hypothetical protein [Synechococcales cyanobacterium T60_A2020_003]